MLTQSALTEVTHVDDRLPWEAPSIIDIDLADHTLGGAITAPVELSDTFTCVVPVNPLS